MPLALITTPYFPSHGVGISGIVYCMPVDNISVVNVNEITPSRAKDTKISRDIFFLSFYHGICFIYIQNNIFQALLMEKKWKIK